jgi:hypothetical protein
MLSQSQMNDLIVRYLSGEIDLDKFEDQVASASWNMHKVLHKDVQRLVGGIELRLAEHSRGHLDEGDLKHELRMILIYGSKLPIENMVILRSASELSTTTISSTFKEPLPIQSVVIGNRMPTTSETRSAAGRTIAGQELLQRSV